MMNPVTDVATKYGAPSGRGWPHMTADLAATVVSIYASNPPKNDEERRHQAVAQAKLAPAEKPGKVSLRRIRLDQGGYDSGGAYWGIGRPLYFAGSEDGGIDLWFRASDRDDAKAYVLARHPAARFFR